MCVYVDVSLLAISVCFFLSRMYEGWGCAKHSVCIAWAWVQREQFLKREC